MLLERNEVCIENWSILNLWYVYVYVKSIFLFLFFFVKLNRIDVIIVWENKGVNMYLIVDI